MRQGQPNWDRQDQSANACGEDGHNLAHNRNGPKQTTAPKKPRLQRDRQDECRRAKPHNEKQHLGSGYEHGLVVPNYW